MHRKLVYGCCKAIVHAPAKSRTIARGIVAPDLLADALVTKFADILMLYLQSVIYARADIELERTLRVS